MELKKRGKYWHVDHQLANGQRFRKSTKRADKYLARLWAEAEIRKIETNGVNVKSNDFGGFVKKYWENQAPYYREKTIQIQRFALQHFIDFINPKSVADVSAVDCQRFVSTYLLGTLKLKPVSANIYASKLRHIFKVAEDWGYCASNPFRRVPYIKFQPEENRVLTPEEICRLLEHVRANKPRYYDLFFFYFFTGMRLSEPSHLQWTDIDYGAKMIAVTWTKTKYNRRVVMLPDVEAMLKARQDAGEKKPFDIDPGRVQEVIKAVRGAVSIPWLTAQAFRRSTTSYLRYMRVPEIVITKIMGHSEAVALNSYFGMENRELINQISPLEGLLPKYEPIPLMKGQLPRNLGKRKPASVTAQ